MKKKSLKLGGWPLTVGLLIVGILLFALGVVMPSPLNAVFIVLGLILIAIVAFPYAF